MNSGVSAHSITFILRWAPFFFLALLVMGFGVLAPRFLSMENMGAILVQSSWLIVVALGMNFVLLAAGVDLSVGATMYLAAVVVGLGLPDAPVCKPGQQRPGCGMRVGDARNHEFSPVIPASFGRTCLRVSRARNSRVFTVFTGQSRIAAPSSQEWPRV